MSAAIPANVVRYVRLRAREVCEYCRIPQWSQEATFHIDHIHPVADGGQTTEDNLALSCITCSLKKGARTHARVRGPVLWLHSSTQEGIDGDASFGGRKIGG